jgi:hypothetical protein
MKFIGSLFLIFTLSLFGESENSIWSNEVHGISGRLFVQEDPDSPFLIVSFELKNNRATIPFHFTPEKLKLVIKDENGDKLIPTFPRDFSGMTPSWKDPIPLLMESVYKFRISHPTVSYNSTKGGRYICLKYSTGLWWLPESGTYSISGIFEDKRGYEENYEYRWHGELNLPSVQFQLEQSEN